MTEVDRAIGSEPAAPRLGAAGLGEPGLDVGPADVLVALVTSAMSLAVLVYGMSAVASAPVFIAAHLAVLVVPAIFLRMRIRRGGELTVPVLLLVATFAAGPVGALGCAIMALTLWRQNPSPARLQDWYDYIAGVVARTRLTRIYDELASGRLPSDPAAKVPRFGPILEGASVEEQQRVLGVIGRRYHAEFRPVLRKALRNSNGFIRAQAAAVASGLDADEKRQLWSSEQGPAAPTALDVEPRRTGPHSDQLRS
jgi:HEAT repeat protein